MKNQLHGLRIRGCGLRIILLTAFCLLLAVNSFAALLYVNAENPTPVFPYDTWGKAATDIQTAVDAASFGNHVIVTNGVYNSGEKITPGYAISNRVLIDKSITVQSISGPENTIICGKGGLSSYAVRCVYLTNGASLVGFTISNGHTFSSGDVDFEQGGGGAFLNHGGVISNCIITDCEAQRFGGGVYCYYGGKILDSELKNNVVYREGAGARLLHGGEINRCHIHNNLADNWDGGGVYVYYEGLVANSLIENNEGYSGAGVYLCLLAGDGPRLYNCTVVNNNSDYDGGGVRCLNGGKVRNSIIYYNIANGSGKEDNYENGGPGISYEYTCTTPMISGTGNIINVPVFYDYTAGDYHLMASSSCVNSGINYFAVGDKDLDNKMRIVNSTIDMGCYELQNFFLDITNENFSVYYQESSTEFSGTNFNFVAGRMWWTNLTSGTSGSITSGDSWTAENVPLAAGENSITVFAEGHYGVLANDSITITRTKIDNSDSPVHYVSTNGLAVWPFTNWTTAATVIQDAVDAADYDDKVLVSNGFYYSGGLEMGTQFFTNRVYVSRKICVESVSGAENTFIVGAPAFDGDFGTGAVRCVYLEPETAISGFTLTNGHTYTSGDQNTYCGGGGAVLNGGGTVSNCVILGNKSKSQGGGINLHHGGTIYNCEIFNNYAGWQGGAALNESGDIKSSIIHNNSSYADGGGGVYFWYGGTSINSIVYYNKATASMPQTDNWRYWRGGTGIYTCTFPEFAGVGNITNEPCFISSIDNNWRLQSTSPCINSGTNALAAVPYDLDDNQRIIAGTVDMGCYEYSFPPFIDITNENTTVNYSVDTYTIAGTNNENVVGGTWTNLLTGETGNFQFSINLDHGDNIVKVSGTNVFGQSTNDVVCIHRKTWSESAPQIATNALVFPKANSIIFASTTTNIIWDVEGITDDIDGTNLTITKIDLALCRHN